MKGPMVVSKEKSDNKINEIASEMARKAIRNINERKLSEQWNKLNSIMTSTRFSAINETDKNTKSSVRTKMLDVIDIFNTIYAKTEALLPVNHHQEKSAIGDRDDLDIFNKLNSRLHIMDIKYEQFVECIPKP